MKTHYYAAIPRENLNGKTADLEGYHVITTDSSYLWVALKEINPVYTPAIIEFESELECDDLVDQMERTDDWEVELIL